MGYEYRTKHAELDAFQKLSALKASFKDATRFVKDKCKDEMASTTQHKLSVCLSFIRAIRASTLDVASSLQNKYHRLKEVDVERWNQGDAFQRIQDHAIELMSTSVKERTQELTSINKKSASGSF